MNGHGPAGLSAALDFILETGVEEIHNKEIALMRRFICLSFFFFSCNPYNKQSRKNMVESMTENMTG